MSEIKNEFEITIPLKTVSELNRSEYWAATFLRRKKQKRIIQLTLRSKISNITLPCIISLTRISPRMLDYDNLVSSQKAIVDSICDLLIPGLKPGQADGDERIRIDYAQETGKKIALKIKIKSDPYLLGMLPLKIKAGEIFPKENL